MNPDIFYFGCWNEPGHYLFDAQGRALYSKRGESRQEDQIVHYNQGRHIDGTLAPRRHERTGKIVWVGMDRSHLEYHSEELPEGQFLRHELDNRFTAISWWDRKQGDKRGACNSTVLWRGKHSSAEMVQAFAEHFPSRLKRLTDAEIALVEVVP